MDIEKLLELYHDADRAARADEGQQTLGYLADILSLADPAMPISWDTGHQFGNDTVTWETEEPFEHERYSQPGYDQADSTSAHPSCYRGIYSDCTFNCSSVFDRSTVGHVLRMVNETIGKSFSGYKGGVYEFNRGTPVWGADTSWGSTGDSRVLTGFKIESDILILLSATSGEG